MQNGDADVPVGVNVGVPDVGDDLELGRPQRVLLGEDEVTLEETALVERVLGPDDHHLESNGFCCARNSLS